MNRSANDSEFRISYSLFYIMVLLVYFRLYSFLQSIDNGYNG